MTTRRRSSRDRGAARRPASPRRVDPIVEAHRTEIERRAQLGRDPRFREYLNTPAPKLITNFLG